MPASPFGASCYKSTAITSSKGTVLLLDWTFCSIEEGKSKNTFIMRIME
jgi:hypothetical protein